MIRTSVTHPIRVDWLPDGLVGLTFAPGKHATSLEYPGDLWKRDLDANLARLREVHRVELLVCLLEDHELTSLCIPNLLDGARRHRLPVTRLPIRDEDVPASRSEVTALVDRIRASAAAGRRVAIHCIGGIGRTGTIAGCYLAATGVSGADALRILQATRGPRCPETQAQIEYVAAFAAAHRAASAQQRNPVE